MSEKEKTMPNTGGKVLDSLECESRGILTTALDKHSDETKGTSRSEEKRSERRRKVISQNCIESTDFVVEVRQKIMVLRSMTCISTRVMVHSIWSMRN